MIFIWLLLILLLILLFISLGFFIYACYHNKAKDKPMNISASFFKQYKDQFSKYSKENKNLVYQDCYIKSKDNLQLHARYYHNDNAKRIILCAHGYRGSGDFDFCLFINRMVKENNLLVIDQRTCGLSEGKFITFGAKEHQDIIQWANYLNTINSNHLPIYLYGVSLGGSSVALCSDYDFNGNVKGIIDDCGYNSMEKIFADVAKNMFHIPSYILIKLMNIWTLLLAGFTMKQADCSNALKNNCLPVLFIHGNSDDFVNVKHGLTNYRLCRKDKDILLIDNAAHALSIYQDSDKYFSKLEEFFNKWD